MLDLLFVKTPLLHLLQAQRQALVLALALEMVVLRLLRAPLMARLGLSVGLVGLLKTVTEEDDLLGLSVCMHMPRLPSRYH